MKKPPTVSRGLILRVQYSDIRDALGIRGDQPIAGHTFTYRTPAVFEVADGLAFQPQDVADHVWPARVLSLDYIFDPKRSIQTLIATIRVTLRATL